MGQQLPKPRVTQTNQPNQTSEIPKQPIGCSYGTTDPWKLGPKNYKIPIIPPTPVVGMPLIFQK